MQKEISKVRKNVLQSFGYKVSIVQRVNDQGFGVGDDDDGFPDAGDDAGGGGEADDDGGFPDAGDDPGDDAGDDAGNGDVGDGGDGGGREPDVARYQGQIKRQGAKIHALETRLEGAITSEEAGELRSELTRLRRATAILKGEEPDASDTPKKRRLPDDLPDPYSDHHSYGESVVDAAVAESAKNIDDVVDKRLAERERVNLTRSNAKTFLEKNAWIAEEGNFEAFKAEANNRVGTGESGELTQKDYEKCMYAAFGEKVVEMAQAKTADDTADDIFGAIDQASKGSSSQGGGGGGGTLASVVKLPASKIAARILSPSTTGTQQRQIMNRLRTSDPEKHQAVLVELDPDLIA